jgi:hypothetical protein
LKAVEELNEKYYQEFVIEKRVEFKYSLRSLEHKKEMTYKGWINGNNYSLAIVKALVILYEVKKKFEQNISNEWELKVWKCDEMARF